MNVIRRVGLLATLAATGCATSEPLVDCDGPCAEADAAPAPRDVAAVDRPVARPDDLVALAITPGNPRLTLDGSATPTLGLRATATQRNGLTRVVTQVRWSLDAALLGSITETAGVFTPSGLGGTVRVRVATTDGSALTADTTVTVEARYVQLGHGATAGDRDLINNAPSGGTGVGPGVDYPLANAVMPRNVFAPDVQFTARHPSPAASDVYRVRLERPHITVDLIARAAMGFRHALTPAPQVWGALAGSDLAEPITITVSVLSGGRRFEGPSLRFRTVDGVTSGAVYYWSPPRSRLTRIDVDTAQRVDFLPNPSDSCIGCHAVSRDGLRLSGFLEGRGERLALYDLSRDLTGNPAPTLALRDTGSRRCVTFNRSATQLAAGDCGANPSNLRMGLLNADGTDVTGSNLGAVAAGFDPEWSPDDQWLAYTNRNNDLVRAASMGNGQFGPETVIHRAADTAGGRVDWHPTWSPDNRWISFQHGDTRRSGEATQGLSGVRGDLWVVRPDGTGLVRLDNANGGAGTNTWRPVFSPFDSGGYFWLLFTSNRPYGNSAAGTRNIKQIWVTALRNRPDGSRDPSEVAYYLPGQERQTALSPYWTPPPCRPNGNACSSTSECCSGVCEPDDSSNRVCRPSTGQCRPRGATCGSAADCCSGLVCTEARVCDLPSPG